MKISKQEIILELNMLLIGSCNCLTKTPEVEYHKDYCKYKRIKKLIFLLEECEEIT